MSEETGNAASQETQQVDLVASAPVSRTAPMLSEEDAMKEEEAFNQGSVPSATAGPSGSGGSTNGKRKQSQYDHDHFATGHKQKKEKKGWGRDKPKRRYEGKDENKRAKSPEDDEEGAMNAAAGGEGGTADAAGSGEGGADGKNKMPKKRTAVLVGFCGTGYSGMQMWVERCKANADRAEVCSQTHGSITIEGEIFAALVKAGAISEDNADDHRKVDISRAARTDAGVHAAGNVISLKMIQDPPLPDGFSDLTAYVNSFLPEQIRVWGFVRTVRSFQARTSAESRIYEYLLPTYCLLPPSSTDALAKRLDERSPGWRDIVGKEAMEFADAGVPAEEDDEVSDMAVDTVAEAEDSKDTAEGTEEPLAVEAIVDREEGDTRDGRGVGKSRGEFERRRTYRIDTRTLERFRELIAQYTGTHNFHNYTIGKPYKDPTVKRFMRSLEVKDPQVYGEIEWVSVQIHGQSFMLHQIRKMIAMAMLACRTGSPPSLLTESFGPQRIHIPKAPPLGLLLEAPQFKTYNDRLEKMPGPGTEDRSPVTFEPYKDQIHAFKVKYIYEKLREEEYATHTYHKFIRQIDCSASDDFAYLNTSGTIPAEALQQRGVPNGRPGDRAKAGAVKADQPADSDEEDQGIDADQLKRGELEG